MTTDFTTTLDSSFRGSDKLWAVLSHLSGFIGVPFVLPLVVYLVMRNDTPRVAEHAKETLNFHISLFLYTIVAAPLCWILIGFALLFAIWGIGLVFAIVAAVKASDGVLYRYPITLRFIS